MDNSKWPEKANFPFAKPGFKYISLAFVVTAMLFFIQWPALGWVVFFISLFICWFFRDPDREIPDKDNCLISPADGKVIIIENNEENEYLSGKTLKISIFMNVFNVHVNRVPFQGIVESVKYFPGKFFNADLDKASKYNERNGLVISTPSGRKYAVVQIAGLVARRIVCKIKEGDHLERGKRYGMICFGSRLDLYLPEDTKIAVAIGDKVTAGTSILGYINPAASQLEG